MEQQISMAENYYLVKKMRKFNLTIKKKNYIQFLHSLSEIVFNVKSLHDKY